MPKVKNEWALRYLILNPIMEILDFFGRCNGVETCMSTKEHLIKHMETEMNIKFHEPHTLQVLRMEESCPDDLSPPKNRHRYLAKGRFCLGSQI